MSMLKAKVVAALLALGAPVAASACSKAPLPMGRPQGRLVMFVGTATTDTLFAGPGAVSYRTGQGHFGVGAERRIHGQVVRAESASAALSPAVRGALAGAVAVLVPWDYGPDCHPVPWPRSARWTPPGTRGLFWGVLRDSAHWVGGRPTIDVHVPEHVPYVGGIVPRTDLAYAAGVREPMDTLLTPEQLLELYTLLPEGAPERDTVASALDPLRAWAREHPELARRNPARRLLGSAVNVVEHARARAVRVPVAGTYRFVVTLASGDSVVLYARTEPGVSSPLESATGAARRTTPADPLAAAAPPEGYYVLTQFATDVLSLPGVRPRSATELAAQGYLAVASSPLLETADSTVWRGSADLFDAAWRIVEGPQRDAIGAARTAIRDMYQSGALSFLPGRFVRDARGRIRFEADIRRKGAPIAVVRGERISTDLLRDR